MIVIVETHPPGFALFPDLVEEIAPAQDEIHIAVGEEVNRTADLGIAQHLMVI